MTAPLALGCESGGREAGDEAPTLENSDRTEKSYGGLATPHGNKAKLDQRGVAGPYGGVGAISPARGSSLYKTVPPRNSVPKIHLSFTKCGTPRVLGPATVLPPNSTMSVQQPGLHEPSRNKPFAPSPERAPAAPTCPKRRTCASR